MKSWTKITIILESTFILCVILNLSFYIYHKHRIERCKDAGKKVVEQFIQEVLDGKYQELQNYFENKNSFDRFRKN